MIEILAAEPSQGCFLPCFCLELTIVYGLQLWLHPLDCVQACVGLLFKGGELHMRSSVATNRSAASI